jgi:murein DD-endopeptidase MepM/ murein hydrolase activator NlpD
MRLSFGLKVNLFSKATIKAALINMVVLPVLLIASSAKAADTIDNMVEQKANATFIDQPEYGYGEDTQYPDELNNQWPVTKGKCYISQLPGGRSSHSNQAAFDFGTYKGKPNANAVNAGEVTYTGWINAGGKTVIIKTLNGDLNIYHHLSSITVSKYDQLNGGDKIGIVGSTGRSTGNHLHVEFKTSSGKKDWKTAKKMQTQFNWKKNVKCPQSAIAKK